MSKTKQVIILGAPGSGKGTQSAEIIKAHKLHHLSTGDMLRKEIADKTLLGQQAKSIMDAGNLVSDEIVLNMVNERLKMFKDDGFLFDGFPRTIQQAQGLDKLLGSYDKAVTHVIQLVVPEDEIIERALARGRDDDNLETVQNRLRVYEEQTAPLTEYYREQEKLHTVQGHGNIETITASILKALDKAV